MNKSLMKNWPKNKNKTKVLKRQRRFFRLSINFQSHSSSSKFILSKKSLKSLKNGNFLLKNTRLRIRPAGFVCMLNWMIQSDHKRNVFNCQKTLQKLLSRLRLFCHLRTIFIHPTTHNRQTTTHFVTSKILISSSHRSI